MHPDNKYIEALLNNQYVVLKELYDTYFGKIRNMILKNGGSSNDAADIMQEALMSIYNRAIASNFVLTCPMDAFLYQVCKNKWINEIQKKKNKVTFIDIDGYNNIGEDSFAQADECLQHQQQKILFEQQFEQLGEACKKLLQLNWSGKNLTEVATILQVTYGYVRKKKSDCMNRLAMLVKQAPMYENLKWK